MGKLTFLIFSTVLLFIVISANVLEYTDSNFDNDIVFHDIALVKFYAPWYLTFLVYLKIFFKVWTL